MDREKVSNIFSCKIKKVILEEYGKEEIHIKKLSHMARCIFFDMYEEARKSGKSADISKSMAFICARSLVDPEGKRLYQDDELDRIYDEYTPEALDDICKKILDVSGISAESEDQEKNVISRQNEDSNSVLQ